MLASLDHPPGRERIVHAGDRHVSTLIAVRVLAVVVAALAAATAARASAERPFYAAVAAGAWHGVVSSSGARHAVPGDRFGQLDLSPDRTSFVAPVGKSKLWIGKVAGGGRSVATRVQTTPPVYGPDGRVVYGAGATIRVLGGATLRPKLPAGARIVEVAASKDAYAATVEWGDGKSGTLKNALYLIRAGGAKLLVRGTDAYSDRPHPVFSPDGSRIAYEQGGDIWVTTTTGTRTRISRTPKAAETGACWSPDGTRLAYTSGRNGVNEVYAATLDGHETRLTHTAPHGAGVPQVGSVAGAWSPEGDRIAVITYNSLGVVPAAGGATTIVRTFTPAASTYLGPVWW